MKKKLLYIAPHRPGRSPGQRFRFEQFLPHLKADGFSVTYSYILNARDDQRFYAPGNLLYKLWIGLKGFLIRLRDLLRLGKFDVVIVYREAHFLGNTFFEKRLAKSRVPFIFDFDDAIWLNDTSEGNAKLGWLKKPEKTADIIALADTTIVGNAYLAAYARQYSPRVQIIPTTIDTQYYRNYPQTKNGIVIGWTGSSTTLKHLKSAEEVFRILHAKYGQTISFLHIADEQASFEAIPMEFHPWCKETEIQDLSRIDIGIMPLPDDQWSKGKCGFKGIQYMSLGKPVVLSPVGVNKDIVEDGVNGFLATNPEEWVNKLSQLIDSKELREQLGKKAKECIESRYSVNAQKEAFLQVLNALL